VATVKLSGGKVVTKEGKVSCTCCGCCMYPATQAVAADLPDAITLLGVGSLSKSGTDYGDTTNGVILESGVWARYVGGVRTTKPCLIDGDGNKTPGNNLVEDQFEPAYFVSNGVQYFPPLTCTVTRVSKCQWNYIDPLMQAHLDAGGAVFEYVERFADGNYEREFTIVYAVLTWEYINDEFGTGYWYLDAEYLNAEGAEDEEGNGEYYLSDLGFGYPRFGTQHTPDGDYNEEGQVTVSIP